MFCFYIKPNDFSKKNKALQMIILKTLKRVWLLLPKSFKKRGLAVIFLLLLNSLLDILGLGAIIPIVLVIVEEGAIQSNEILNQLYLATGSIDEKYFIVMLCLFLILVLILKNIGSVIIVHYQAKFTFELRTFFSQNLFRSLYKRGLPYFKKMNSQNVMRNINGLPTSFATGIMLPLLNFFTEALIVTFIISGLLFYNYKVIVILTAVVFPVFGVFYQYAKNKIKHFQEEIYRISPEMVRASFEAIYGYTDVKVTGTEEKFFKRHKDLQLEVIGNNIMSMTYQSVPPKVIEFSMFLGVSLIITYGLFAFDNRSDLIALLGLFALAAYRILPSINRLMISLMTIESFEYTLDILESDDARFSSLAIHHANIKTGHFESLELRNLNFSYQENEPKVLRDINLKIKRGEVIGVIGESGSGKSTLMNLILGFFPVGKDHFLVNDKSLTEREVDNWQRYLGYVSQDVFMMDATIKENVAFGLGLDEIDDDKVWQCLERSSLKKLVQSFEKGINTKVGERGGLLSGGQKQRIGIARALYSGAQILLFDEATSALDTETEKEIAQSIFELKNDNFTMIIIAHRYTSLSSCDRILELELGSIKNEMEYHELIQRIK